MTDFLHHKSPEQQADQHPNPIYGAGKEIGDAMHVQRAAVELKDYPNQSERMVASILSDLSFGGLHPVYHTVQDWLFDFYPDFDYREGNKPFEQFKASSNFPKLVAQFKLLFKGYDLSIEIDEAIWEADAQDALERLAESIKERA